MDTPTLNIITKKLDLPRVDNGTFECIIDTDPDFSFLIRYLFETRKNCKKYLLIDDILKSRYDFLIREFKNAGTVKIIYASSTETFKSFSQAENIMNEILHTYPSKEDIIVSIGGGVVLNMGGFIAGLMLRGMNFIHVPTTLSSQTDVFLGGKQAVNFLGFKNQIGFFRDPELCYINSNFLLSIPVKTFKHQMVEGLKLCLTCDETIFWNLYNLISTTQEIAQLDLASLIEQFIQLKAPLVREDPYENNIGLCNVYGHTLGHAIEMASDGNMSHCEAVGLGMLLASKLALKMGIGNSKIVDIHKILLDKLEIDAYIPKAISIDDIFHHFKHDKKISQGRIPFVFISEIGKISTNGTKYFHLAHESQIKETIMQNYQHGL